MKHIFVDKEVWSYRKDPSKVYVAVIGSSKAPAHFYDEVKTKTLEYLQKNNIPLEKVVFVSGGAKGVDKMAEKMANELGIDIIVIRPDYEMYYFKQAPLERDKRIAEISDFVIAFYRMYGSSRGTDFTVQQAKKLYKKVKKFYLKI